MRLKCVLFEFKFLDLKWGCEEAFMLVKFKIYFILNGTGNWIDDCVIF